MPAYEYDQAAIRELLLAAFAPQDLRRFCQDRSELRRVVYRFPERASLNEMTDEVLGYCECHVLLDDLLTEVAGCNPRQFERFRDRIYGHRPLDAGENRLRPAGEPAPRLQAARLNVVQIASERVLRGLETTPWADHGTEHATRVQGYLEQLIVRCCQGQGGRFGAEERFVVQAAAWLHNVGLSLQDPAESACLAGLFPRQNWPRPGTPGWASLLSDHYPELSAEMIRGSVEAPDHYSALGLGPADPVEAIAQVVRMHARPDLAGPETVPWQGETLRVRLLAALLRLAASLNIGGLTGPVGATPEARLYHWLRSYIRSISLDGPEACIQVECWLPSGAYVAPVEALIYDVLVRRYTEVLPVLGQHGCQVGLAAPRRRFPALAPPMPDDLWALATDPAQLRQILARETRVLGEGPATMPRLAPYPFGAARKVVSFGWDLGPDFADCSFQVALTDMQTHVTFGAVEVPAGTTGIAYPATWPQPIPGRRYQWAVRARRAGRVIERWQGIFWLLSPAERQTVEQREQAIGQADPLGQGLVAFQAGLYGEAAAYLERAIEGGPPADILARRALAQLYESVAGELGRIGKHDLAQPFARAADEQYGQLRAIVKESKE